MRVASERSETVHATREVIKDIESEVKGKRYGLAEKKLALFRTRWEEYVAGGPRPSSWFREIIDLRG
jgi:hypothetical protein